MEELLRSLSDDYKRIDKMMKSKGVYIDEESGKPYFTGYAYKTLYDWDQYFEAIAQLYLGWDGTLVKNGVTIFLDNQREDGFIWRSVPRAEGGQGDEHVKPFLAQIAMLLYRQEKNLDWIGNNYYERLKKYIIYWLDARSPRKNGLSIWDSAPHTGMDNQHERAGYWYDCFCEGVDLNCYIVRECRAMANIARIKDREADAQYFTDRADAVARAVQTMWDDADGLFYDNDCRTGKPLKVKYAGIFAAMWAGIASPAQAKRMVEEHIINRDEFWREFPVSVYAATEKGYTENYLPGDLGCSWRANTWIPTNYYVFQGLRDYGYDEIARKLADITLETVRKVGDREYYTSETVQGRGLDPFWGWSLLAYFMPMEYACGYDPTKLTFSARDLAVIRVL